MGHESDRLCHEAPGHDHDDGRRLDQRRALARSILAKYQADVDRWDTEVNRLKLEVEKGVVDPQILLESTKQLKSAIAARDAAKATIAKVDAEVLSKQAVLAKAKVDVEVPSPTWRCPSATRSGSRRGWATSRSPHPTTA